MAAPRLAVAAALVALADDVGVFATTSPAELVANLPGLLVPPPALVAATYAGPDATWRLVLVAAGDTSADPAASWGQLDLLLDQLWPVLDVERADPSSYALPDGATHPAYVLTITTPGA